MAIVRLNGTVPVLNARQRRTPGAFSRANNVVIVDFHTYYKSETALGRDSSTISRKEGRQPVDENFLSNYYLSLLNVEKPLSVGDVVVDLLMQLSNDGVLSEQSMRQAVRLALPQLFEVTPEEIKARAETAELPSTRLAPLLPTAAPEAWKDRPSRKSEPAYDFLRRVYGPWLQDPELRTHLRVIDRPLYNAVAGAKRNQRHLGIPDDLKTFFENDIRSPAQIDDELERLNIQQAKEALDPGKVADRREAERLYAAKARRTKLSTTR